MPANIYEDSLDLTLESVEPVPISVAGSLPPCYPLPLLSGTGRTTPRSVRVVVLENSYLRVVVCPELGGRILELLDKRTRMDIIPRWSELQTATGGPRGVWLSNGIRILGGAPGEECRRNGMGQVDVMVREPADEESPAAVLMFELDPGRGVSWHAAITLLPDRAELLIEVSLLNRSLLPVPFETGIAIELPDATIGGSGLGWSCYSSRDAGFWLSNDRSWAPEALNGQVMVRSGEEGSPLLPREVLNWKMRLVPFSNLGSGAVCGEQFGVSRENGQLRLQVSERRLEAELTLATEEGDFAARQDLHPETQFGVNLASLPTLTSVTLDDRETLSFEQRTLSPMKMTSAIRRLFQNVTEDTIESSFFLAAKMGYEPDHVSLPGLDHARCAAIATHEMRRGNRAEADKLLEQALLTNGEDPLLWWGKAWNSRLGRLSEERPELLNAHYLAPMEPCLRAESFLQQGVLQGKEGNPITRILAKNPDAALDVVHRILDSGETQEAMQLIDELLRHEEIGLLRVYSAWMLAFKASMKVEAAQHIMALDKAPLRPPFPWRRLEVQAVRETAVLFASSNNLATLASMVGLYQGSAP